MLFNTVGYAVFFAIVLVAYFSLRHRAQNVFLLVASYVFYAHGDWRFLSLLLLRPSSTFPPDWRFSARTTPV